MRSIRTASFTRGMGRRHRLPQRDRLWASPAAGPRVLIEERDGAMAWAEARELQAAGYAVAVCEGPAPDDGVGCALARNGCCELAEQADVVLCNVTGPNGSAQVLDGLRGLQPSRPILRTAAYQDRRREADSLDGVTMLEFPLLRGELSDAVRDALRP